MVKKEVFEWLRSGRKTVALGRGVARRIAAFSSSKWKISYVERDEHFAIAILNPILNDIAEPG
jgi:hypothetical protein